MFTGLYPVEHGVNHARAALSQETTTLVQRLKQQGYQTGAFVAMPWTSISTKLGFDTLRVADKLFDTMNPQWWHIGLQKAYWRLVGRKDKGASRINAEVHRWLTRQRAPRHPFFLYLHYLEPHGAYWPPKSYRERFISHDVPVRELRKLSDIELAYLAAQVELSATELAAINDLYDAEVRFLDDRVGEFICTLSSMGLLDDTLIILTADHGENLGEHDLLGHQYCLYDTLLRVPLIIRSPRISSGGQRITSMVQTLDIMATIADVLGVQESWQPGASRWNSLVPLGLDRASNADRAYAQYLHSLVERFQRRYPSFDYSKYDRRLWSIRTEQHKLILDDRGSTDLYAYRTDPLEASNVASQQPKLVEELKGELDDWLARLGAPVIGPLEEDPDSLVLERLRSLGYL
jgi:arylsulfatase A-like enzyme